MRSVVLTILIGLVGAALLHLVIILALPRFTERDAFSRVLGVDEPDSFYVLPTTAGPATPGQASPGRAGLVNDDPYLRVAVCGFSVSESPVRFLASGAVPFWSIAIYDANNDEVFSMTDKTAVNGTLDLVLATPLQLDDLRKSPLPGLAQSILVAMPRDEGYAVLRVLAPVDSYAALAAAYLAGATCQPVTRAG